MRDRQVWQETIFKGKLAALMVEFGVKLLFLEEPPTATFAFRGPGIDLDVEQLMELEEPDEDEAET